MSVTYHVGTSYGKRGSSSQPSWRGERGEKPSAFFFCCIPQFIFLYGYAKWDQHKPLRRIVASLSKMAARMRRKRTVSRSMKFTPAVGRLYLFLVRVQCGQEVIDLKGRETKKGAHPYLLLYSLYAMPPPQRHMARARKNIRGAPSYIRRQVSQKIAFLPLTFFS